RHGQGFVVLDVVLDGSGPFRDASAWTRAEAAAQLEARVAELEARIEAWEQDPDIRAADLAEQRARLAALRAELAAAQTPVAAADRYFRATYEELPPEAPRDPAVEATLNAYNKRVNEHN